MVELSTITCPRCGHQASEPMPLDACVILYDCKGCGARLRALPGDCCVLLLWFDAVPVGAKARDALIEAYDADSRQEALLRAFLAELDHDRPAARFLGRGL